ncbi:Dps family protein [Nocardia sp. alder85J]|uniref:Dps family protein n=1 Tax=Nocardia sp. alder85J TaxID=2862949 RepID=UPI001CD2AA37|nr:DNA starvation/stationary phase protection protein [Nocardia sp. alder85J]MCX4092958.1 DNA starvation/stationary phase protection protein [Nocardia sp. alder85J]
MAHPITTELDQEQQRLAGDALRDTVIDLTDLALIGKQAHWNVIGPRFRSLHLALDELVDAAREFTDAAAERATAVGVSPDGRVRAVADRSGIDAFPAGWQRDDDVSFTIAADLAIVIRRLRRRIEVTDKADPVTQDLLIEITARLEQLHWMWEAQSA